MKIELIDDNGKSTSPLSTGDGKGELFSYINTITEESDPYIRFDSRPMALCHLSSLSDRAFPDRIKCADGSVVSIEDMMGYVGNPELSKD